MLFWKNNNIVVELVTLPHFEGELPKYETDGAAGADVRAQISEPMTLQPKERALVPTALSVAVPEGYEIQVRPRSGLAFKQGIGVLNSPGTVDSDFRGEIKVIVCNLGDAPVTINPQDRIAQIVLCPISKIEWQIVDSLPQTNRGGKGFGSTGV
jgi:dUTP pyrophosphatase